MRDGLRARMQNIVIVPRQSERADILSGDFGADTLWGGAGNDRFVFKYATAGFDEVGNQAYDTIADFDVGDTIAFDGFPTSGEGAVAIGAWQDGDDVVIGVYTDNDLVFDYTIAVVMNASLAEVVDALALFWKPPPGETHTRSDARGLSLPRVVRRRAYEAGLMPISSRRR
ncbi:hypothetical protein MTR62_15410 [Novosphingobium sp. 1949]|uniref:Uncharacterized protein n=1 Tax=Novosphingobium organovorum TaxID=2930092 RepID=A0ABT0BG88_9SPHN|nr:hypothetical protein [Novosphingobium organovorum]MCJ2184072.1 hypothetical protein [Novosphingobium organovorum]